MERLTRLIDAIYDCALEDHDWSPTVVEIAEFCGGANAALVMTDPRIDLAHVLAPRADPTVIEDYNRFWWQHDPTVQATASIRPGVTTDLADTGREAFFASAFFNDYWSKSGLGAERVATNLFVADGAFGSIVLQASVENDEITEEARKRFDLVVPHLIRAMNTRRRLQGLAIDLQKERNRDHDGFMSIGQERRVLYADDGALAMLEDGCGMALWNRRLVLDDPLADTRLGQAIAACGGGGATPGTEIRLASPADGADLSITVLPARDKTAASGTFSIYGERPVAILVLRNRQARQRAHIDRLAGLFGLTLAEARLAIEMARGDGREAAAARCGISVNTARSHLTRIFEKTGVSRQAELAKLLSDSGIT